MRDDFPGVLRAMGLAVMGVPILVLTHWSEASWVRDEVGLSVGRELRPWITRIRLLSP